MYELNRDDIETIRIHLNAYKEKLFNQGRWKEAQEYQRLIDRFMTFVSVQPEPFVKDTISRKAVIDTEGLEEEIRCEMCKNPMHTDRGCDGNCKYDEKLYEKIMQILNERIKPLPPAEPEIIHCRECQHHRRDNTGCYYCVRKEYGYGWGLNDFCSDAERRTDGKN